MYLPQALAVSDETQTTQLQYYSKLSVYMEKFDLLTRILCIEPSREVAD